MKKSKNFTRAARRYRKVGLSIVELMIALAVIGILGAVAVPNYKIYKAKSRTLEAKIRLSEIYSAEKSFYMQYSEYDTCLYLMGIGTPEGDNYYASGFKGNVKRSGNSNVVGCTRTGGANGKRFWKANKSEVGWFKEDGTTQLFPGGGILIPRRYRRRVSPPRPQGLSTIRVRSLNGKSSIFSAMSKKIDRRHRSLASGPSTKIRS